MYSAEVLDHLRNPRNPGELPPPALVVEAANPACGDLMRLSALIEGDAVAECAFQVRGCTASIAAGSALTELMRGRTTAALVRIAAADVETALGGLPPESRHAAVLAIDALRALLRAAAK